MGNLKEITQQNYRCVNTPGIRKSARSGVTQRTLGSLSGNDDGDVNENGKKAIGLD